MQKRNDRILTLFCCGLALWLAACPAPAAESLAWNKQSDKITADVRNITLMDLLERVALETGWQVFLEPGATHNPSAKFKDLPAGEALHMLLGKLNFALIPQSAAPSRLYVFSTAINNATQQIAPAQKKVVRAQPKRIGNELIVRLKPGGNIDEIAKALGAKVVGAIPEINAYRLKFEDDAAADAARDQLASNPAVTGVDYNYHVDRPEAAQGVISSTGLPSQLTLKSAGESSGLVVGIVDTAVQTLGGDLEKLIAKRISITGESALDGSEPIHGTTMLESILRGLQSVTGASSTSVQFVSVDVFGRNGTTTTFDVASGIVAAVNNGANWINVSLGSDGSSAVLQNIVQTVTDRGIPIFGAAGNAPTGDNVFPAAYEPVVAVTAINRGQIAPYANMADFVDVAAPGAGIVYYKNQPYFIQGTSVSTAYATGAAVGLAEKSGSSWQQVQPTFYNLFTVPSKTGP